MRRLVLFNLFLLFFICHCFSINRKSYLQKKFENSEKQISEFSCGFAALTTILKNFYNIEISQKDLISSYGLDILKDKRGVSFLDLKKISESFGLTAKGFLVNLSALDEFVKYSQVPIILHTMNNKRDINSGHFIVIFWSSKDYFYVSDPKYGECYIPRKRIENIMTGNILLILPNETDIERKERFKNITKKINTIYSKNKFLYKADFYEKIY